MGDHSMKLSTAILTTLLNGTLFAGDTVIFDSALIGGSPVKPGEYTEVVRITNGRSWCTGTVVGPTALLTAAHCTESGGEVYFEHSGLVYNATCTLAPDYTQTVGDQDMALCKLSSSHPGPYASISQKPVSLLSYARLIGYGCVQKGGGGGNDGILRVGLSMVVRVPSDTYYSFHTRGNVALCYGDSGGPAFVADNSSHHTILGVNSRGDIKTLSLLTAVYHPNSISFVEKWESENDSLICGSGASCTFTKKNSDEACGY
tara:strand:- start:754 stop:1533 length:780 start_codon:yes stop_codon:yes gene_type:complete